MSEKLAIRVNGISKSFGQYEVIKSCSINVEENMIYALVGANGAGKTTIFKMISGLLFPDAGQISLLGKNIFTDKDFILSHIGTLISTPIFYEHLSAKENISIHLAYMGKEGINPNVFLEKVGLHNVSDKAVARFSLGMRQRLAIARAISHKPKILILDEPLNGLDPLGIKEMRDFFINLVKNEDMTILISSHILGDIEHMADKIGIIINGRVAEEDSVKELKSQGINSLEDYIIEKISGGNHND